MKTLTLTAFLDFDDREDVEVEIEVRADEDGWDLISVCENGKDLDLTSDLDAAVTNHVNDFIWEALADEAAAEADYRYEEYRERVFG